MRMLCKSLTKTANGLSHLEYHYTFQMVEDIRYPIYGILNGDMTLYASSEMFKVGEVYNVTFDKRTE